MFKIKLQVRTETDSVILSKVNIYVSVSRDLVGNSTYIWKIFSIMLIATLMIKEMKQKVENKLYIRSMSLYELIKENTNHDERTS